MKKSRIIAAATTSIAVLSTFCFSAEAYMTPSKTWGTTSSGKSFRNEWEISRDLYVNDVEDRIGNMTYGYDTDWINEDYCECYFTDHNSRASVYRSGYGITEGNIGNPAVWSCCWVNHKTSTITYYAESFGQW